MAMATQSELPAYFTFGPFEVNAATGELRRSGIRIRLSAQPFRILMALLARPGELVSREQPRDEVWTDSTFVDFDDGLNTAINKLRRALGDAAGNPRYIETHPGRGYRFIGALQGRETSNAPSPEGSLIGSQLPERPGVNPLWWLATACLVSFTAGWWLHRSPVAPHPWSFSRLTADVGFSDQPALSPDGQLVSYSSDQSQDGQRDLYVKQVGGGLPIRMTFDGAGNTSPDFSPDGNKIVFQSTRNGGGIYEIPAFGGEARLLAKRGLNPKFSPDGLRVAYWISGPYVAFAVPGSGSVWVVPTAGGQPQRIGPTFTNARYPIWAPDGKHVLFVGYTSDKAAESSSIDWWLADTDGGPAVKTGVYDALTRVGLVSQDRPDQLISMFPNVPLPGCWTELTNNEIFSTQSGDTSNLWETSISLRTGKVSGVITRLTAGAENEPEPSCASGDLLKQYHSYCNVPKRSLNQA